MEKKQFTRDLKMVQNEFPFMEYEYSKGKIYPYKITDDFEISDNEGNHWGTFRASVYFHHSYPKEFPVLLDESKIFPWENDWHISPNTGECCVCSIIEKEEVAKSGISLLDFILKYVRPFYANQLYRQEFGEYKNGEYAHHGEGVWQALEEEFNTMDRSKIRQFLMDMRTKRGRNDVCFCGSGKKYKKCHLTRTKLLETVMKKINLDI